MREKRFGGLVTEWSDYLKLFREGEGHKAIGEASVCYLWSESAARNIRALFRMRASSWSCAIRWRWFSPCTYTLLRSLGKHHTFREAIQIGSGAARRQNRFYASVSGHGPLLPASEALLAKLSRKNEIRIYLYEEYQAEPARMLADIFRFLECGPGFFPGHVEALSRSWNAAK